MDDEAAADRTSRWIASPLEPEVHPAVAAAFRGLDQAGVVWALVRGADDLTAPSGDVDLLVDADQRERAGAALTRAGLPRLGVMGHGSHRFHFRWDPPSRQWIKLDVVTEIRFGRYQQLRTPLAPGFLDRRRRVGDIWRLDPRDEAWLLLLHLLLDKRRLAPSRRASLRVAVSQAAPAAPAALFLNTRIGPGTATRVLEVCRREADPEFAAFAAAITRRWARRDPVRVASTWLITLAARFLDLPFPGHPRGLVVRIAGPDGRRSKTLRTTVRRDFPGPRRSAGGGWAVLTARLHRRLGRLVLVAAPEPATRPPDRSAGGVRGALTRLPANLAPTPDLVLLVDESGAVACPQSPATPRDGAERPDSQGSRIVVLDRTRSVEELAEDAMTAIWARLGTAARARTSGPASE